jgi:hypothetical protein
VTWPYGGGWEIRTLARRLKWCLIALGWQANLRFLRTGRDRWCPLPSPICRSRVYLACTAATSADGAGMLWAKVAHRAPDERPGFGGRRVCLGLHKSLDDPTGTQTLDAQPVADDLPEPQQLLV